MPKFFGVVGRLGGVELVLLPERDDDLVDQRVAQAADLDLAVVAGRCPRAEPGRPAVDGPVTCSAGRYGRGPHADDGVRRPWGGRRLAVAGDLGLRDLQDDRVDVVARQVVLAAPGVARAVPCGRMSMLMASNVAPRSTKNGSSTLAGEDLAAAGQARIAWLATAS